MNINLGELDKLRKHVPEIIADGMFKDSGTPAWELLLWKTGEQRTTRERAALDGLFEKIATLHPELKRVPFKRNPPDHTEAPDDLLTVIYTEYGIAGFLIGLAVGQQLGPHAFSPMTSAQPDKAVKR